MSQSELFSVRWARAMNRIAARQAARTRTPTAFVSHPEPRTIGSHARGKQLCAGNFLFAGHLLQQPDMNMWDLLTPDESFAQELHGFVWLDDLAAVGDAVAITRARDWVWRWIDEFGGGGGPGWTPDLTGKRLIRWISHALFLLRGQDPRRSEDFQLSLARQTAFLNKRWHTSSPGLPRFEAITGLIYAGISLEGMEGQIATAMRALADECNNQIDKNGALPSRNPEELLDIFTLLNWAAMALSDSGRSASDAHLSAIERIAPTLRSLRHADGALARFHGGGRGLPGRLDGALANSGIKRSNTSELSMGFARLSAGRTSIIVDAAPPPVGPVSSQAHASTLAFELTSGRRPLIVNCGSGASFGQQWRRAGRATPSHSALVLSGHSSSRLGIGPQKRHWLVHAPRKVPSEFSQMSDGLRFEGSHDGYVATHGVQHVRKLEMTFDGRGVAGEELLLALSDADKKRFDKAMDTVQLQGIPFEVRFHLHPGVDASLDMGGTAVSMALKSGEIWVLRTESHVQVSLEPSVYLEKTRLKPRATKQIVLSGRAIEYATRVRWSLAKPHESPVGIRDVAHTQSAPVAET